MDLALNEDLFLKYPELEYEIINGEIFYLAPPIPARNHGITSFKLSKILDNYFTSKGGQCRVSHDNAYLRIDLMDEEIKKKIFEINKQDMFRPDIMVVCDRSIDKAEGIIGAPTLVVEVLSPKTHKNDKGVKKDVYEALGVGEYWIVATKNRWVEIYVLKDGKYKLWDTFRQYSEKDYEDLAELEKITKEKSKVITEFSPHSFPELKISINEVFHDLFE